MTTNVSLVLADGVDIKSDSGLSSLIEQMNQDTPKVIINHEPGQQDPPPEAQARVNMVFDGVRPERGFIVYRPGRR